MQMVALASMRRILGLATGVIAGLVLFLGGMFTVLTDMILTTRSADQLSFSQASIVGISLIVISALVEWVVFSRRNWEPIALPAEPIDAPKVQPIADALADLIREFTAERKMAQAPMSEQMPTAHATHPSATASPAYN